MSRAAKPLSYLSLNDVYKYMDIGKRRTFAKRCPYLRREYRKLPFCLEKVYMHQKAGIFTVTIDAVSWEFFEADFHLITFIKVSSTSGKVKKVESDVGLNDLMHRLMTFYLNRPGTRVSSLFFENFSFQFTNIRPFLLFNLSITSRVTWSRGAPYVGFNPECFEFFRNLRLRTLEVDSDSFTVYDKLRVINSPLSYHIISCQDLNVEAETLVCWGEDFRDFRFLRFIPHAKFVIWDREANPQGFMDMCEKLQQEVTCKDGSSYGGKFFKPGIRVDLFMTNFRNKFRAEVKFVDGIPGYCIKLVGDLELFITAKEMELDPKQITSYHFEATVQRLGTAVYYYELALKDKLKYWKIRKDCWVLRKLTAEELRSASKKKIQLHSSKLNFESYSVVRHKQRVIQKSMSLAWFKDFHMLFPLVFFEILFLIGTTIVLKLYTFLNSLIITAYLLIMISLFTLLNYLLFRPWRSWRTPSGEMVKLQVLCPP